ncbi:MAG: hypothetical protein HOW97_42620 [Catenulispora sp.]|nr:hypothetical protein [Catenulispora sp.]
MNDVIDYSRFADRLAAARAAGPEHRWDLLREFQAEWGYTPSDGPRWFGEDLAEHQLLVRYLSRPEAAVDEWPVAHRDEIKKLRAERGGEETGDRYDRPPIPEALTQWWLLPENSFADKAKLYWTHPEWPPTWRPDPNGYGVGKELPKNSPYRKPGEDPRLCVFMAEYEYCNEWGYLASEARLDDPRVLVSVGRDWVEQASSVSEFFLRIAVDRLPDHFGWTGHLGPDADAEKVPTLVRAQLPEVGLLPWRELAAHSVVHGGPDVLVALDSGKGDVPPVRVYGRTHEAVAALGRQLGIDWSIREPLSQTRPLE